MFTKAGPNVGRKPAEMTKMNYFITNNATIASISHPLTTNWTNTSLHECNHIKFYKYIESHAYMSHDLIGHMTTQVTCMSHDRATTTPYHSLQELISLTF